MKMTSSTWCIVLAACGRVGGGHADGHAVGLPAPHARRGRGAQRRHVRGRHQVDAVVGQAARLHRVAEDILINNIAYLLRRYPIFLLPGDGSYKLQPVLVEDVADLAVEGVYRKDNYIVDAVGPDIFTFKEMVQLIGEKVGAKRPLIPVPPRLALLAAQLISLFVKDVVLTPEEVDGLMAGLLVSKDLPLGRIRLADWMDENKYRVGAKYASEPSRHYG